MKLFDFEPKVGWSEILSLCALLFAVAAFYGSCATSQPQITVENVPVGLGVVPPTMASSQSSFGVLVPLVLSNRGGRPVTLISIGRSKVVPPLLIVSGKRVVPAPDSAYHIYLAPPSVSELSLPSWRFAVAMGRPLESVDLLVGLSIPVGESRMALLAIRSDLVGADRAPVTQLMYSLDAHFSDGQVVPIRGALEVKN